MSSSFAFVGEGKTDFSVFVAALSALPGGLDCIATQIQPPYDQLSSPDDQGEFGGGWRGVLSWCKKHCHSGASPLEAVLLSNFSSVIIHVDADIAGEVDLTEIGLAAPCPPAMDTVSNIGFYIASLLERDCGEEQNDVVLMIPSQATEAWIVASGVIPGLPLPPDLECISDPANLLYGKHPQFVRMKEGSVRKLPGTYIQYRPQIAAHWGKIAASCQAANTFTRHLRSCIS